MLLSLDEFCDRTSACRARREEFRWFVEIRGMEMSQTSSTWRRLWNEFRKGASGEVLQDEIVT